MSALHAEVAGRLAAERQRELLAEAAHRRLAVAPSLRASVGRALIDVGIWLAPEARPLIRSEASRRL